MASQPPRRGFFARIFGLCTRLFIWYSIITVAFRCPTAPTDLTDSSPLLCTPATQIRELALPYVKPYFDHYAGPYLDMAEPYVTKFNDKIYLPVSSAGLGAYEKYGAPRVAQVQSYGEKEYDRVIRPLLDDVNGKISTQYQTHLAPHVDRAHSAVHPYIDQTRKTAAKQYDQVLLPTYQKSLPYLQNGYGRSRHYVTEYGLPYSRYALEFSTSFITRKIWPPIRVLYGRNVEPQLSKIKERLASYRDSKKLEAAVDTMDSVSAPSATGTPTTYPSTTDYGSAASYASSVAAAATSSKSPEPLEVTEELKRWQAKFAKAADQGAEDLARRVSNIASNHKSHQIEGTGAALVTELEESTTSAHSSLQSTILSTVSSLPDDASESDQNNAYDGLRTVIRGHGNTIKEKAQSLRLWKLKSNDELGTLLDQASSSTLSVLDSIRDLGLQEIGMRWSASDHITYEDWTQYHKLKQSFHDWRETVAEVVKSHEGVSQTRLAAEELEDKGMGIAQSAAEELARLKDVARYKIHAQDTSDDFSTHKLPAAAARLGQKILSKASSAGEAITATLSSQNMAESIISAATSSAASAASEVSESLSEARESAASVAAAATDRAADAAEHASDSAFDMWAAASALTSSKSDAIARSSASILAAMASAAGSSAPSAGAVSAASSSISSAASAYGTTVPASSAISSSLSSAAASAESAARSVTSELRRSSGSFSGAATSAAGSWASRASERAKSAVADGGPGMVNDGSGPADSVEELRRKARRAVGGAADGDGDTVDAVRAVSESVRSQVSEAGDAYATVTQTLRERASVLAEEGRGML